MNKMFKWIWRLLKKVFYTNVFYDTLPIQSFKRVSVQNSNIIINIILFRTLFDCPIS